MGEDYMAPGVSESITEWEGKAGVSLTDREKTIFQFGHAYGRRNERQELRDLKIIE